MSSPGQGYALVMVVGPYGRHEVSLRMDIPVSRLMPGLLDIAGLTQGTEGAARETWQLLAPGGRILAASGTLDSQGLRPGAVIHLVSRHHLSSVEPLASVEPPDDIMEDKLFPVDSGTSSYDDAPPSGPSEHSVAPPMPTAQPMPTAAPMPTAPPVPATDGLSPLQRVEMLLPMPVGRATRLAAGAQALLGRIGWPEQGVADATTAANHGTETIRALYRWAESVTQRPTGSASPEALEQRADGAASAETADGDEWSTNRLLPADFTVAARPTRMESARRLWRELDYLTQLEARVTGPRLLRCATIAVVSPKGGVGKTTVTALLGTLFSLLRRDPTVAIDTNPDFGSLGRVLTPDQSWYVDDLARLVAQDDELSLTALDSHLGRAIHGLLVVPAPTDPERMATLDEYAYRHLITRLKDFFSLILLDCGTGLQDPASAAAIATADQVLLVTDAQPATASLVAESTRLLHQWGRPITVVVNRMPARGSKLDLQQLSRYLPAARGLIVIPDDVVAATKLAAGSFDWRDAPVAWQRAVRRLAVVLVADWPSLGLAR